MQTEYLGDGLYVAFDGYRLRLMANSPTEPTDIVYLDPSVWNNLLKFVHRFHDDEEETVDVQD